MNIAREQESKQSVSQNQRIVFLSHYANVLIVVNKSDASQATRKRKQATRTSYLHYTDKHFNEIKTNNKNKTNPLIKIAQ